MLEHIPDGNVLFLDIETVSQKASFEELDEGFQTLWAEKNRLTITRDGLTPEQCYLDRAAILAEFGKVVCVSMGFFHERKDGREFRVKSYAGHDEAALLSDFTQGLADFAALVAKRAKAQAATPARRDQRTDDRVYLCAHNGKEFDFPYLARRMLVNGLPLPPQLDLAGRKPWEVPHLDTLELWKFGDYKHFTSLKLLTAIFGIPSPKDDMSGKDVGPAYWQDGNLRGIATYCQKDVVAIAQLFLRYKGQPLLPAERVHEAELAL